MADQGGRWVWQPDRRPPRDQQGRQNPRHDAPPQGRNLQQQRPQANPGGVQAQQQGLVRQQFNPKQQPAPKAPQAKVIPDDRPFIIDARYRSMTCYNCGEPGHFVGNCVKPKICFICNVPGHHMNVCPQWNSPPPMASYMGSAGLGLGFYHLDVPDSETIKWLNLQNCGVVKIKEGDISLAELENELSEIFCKEWPWQIRELDVKQFLVRFSPHRKMTDIKNYPSFDLRKPGVKVEVLEWVGNLEPYSELQEVWVQVRGIPPIWCAWKVFAQLASGFGIMVEMDWSSLFRSFYEVARVKIACRNPVKIPKEGLYEMNKKLFLISLTVEGFEQIQQSDMPVGKINDINDDEKEDDEEADDLDGVQSPKLARVDIPEGSGTKQDNSLNRSNFSRSHAAMEERAQDKQLEDSMNANEVASLICPVLMAPDEEEDYMSQVSRWLEFQQQAEKNLKSAECMDFLQKMELVASDGEDDLDEDLSEEHLSPTSHGKNLLEEFSNCVDIPPPTSITKEEVPASVLEKKKSKEAK
ncbi:hypothetical protein PVAP13_3KG130500 [Panicum virgatum]|nr:hypothetical protein PVAP13_3KG130500 [Panicum virgatum]